MICLACRNNNRDADTPEWSARLSLRIRGRQHRRRRRALNLSAPAVSRLVSGLEAEPGLTLFQRSGRNLSPSSEGTQSYAQTHRLLASIDDLPRIADDIREG